MLSVKSQVTVEKFRPDSTMLKILPFIVENQGIWKSNLRYGTPQIPASPTGRTGRNRTAFRIRTTLKFE
uniref:Ribosomal protein L23 n=1 Tax=Romanomermis culicivorax TaxID=13658 RepID=A0A915IMR0_ROMCU